MQWKDFQPLRECPFCGGEARIMLEEEDRPDECFHNIYCTSCGVQFWVKSKSEAIAAWNRRTEQESELPASSTPTNELRELSGITGELERFRAFHERYAEQTSKKYVDDICALTARAEQAERERDALLTDFSTIERDGLCEVCSFGDSSQISKEDCMEDCCFNYRTWRGQPNKGEGK